MTLTYRDVKGEPLTSAEYDANIRTLKALYDALVASPPEAISISHFVVTGSLLTIVMTNAVEHGPFILPLAQWRFVGEWQAGITMLIGDLFMNAGTLYFVRVQHVAALTFDPDLFTIDGQVYQVIMPARAFSFGLNFYYKDVIGEGGDILWQHVADRAFTIGADFVNCEAYLRTACSGNPIVLPIYLNGVVVGDVMFTPGVDTDARGGQYGSISGLEPSVSIDVVARDILAVGQPYESDADAAGLSVSINALITPT